MTGMTRALSRGLRSTVIVAVAVAFGASAESASVFQPAESTAIVRARAAALLMSGQEGGNLSLEVLAVPFSEGGLRSSVAVVTEVPGSQLLRGAQGSELPVEVFVYGLDGDQVVHAKTSLAVRLDLELQGTLLQATGLKVVTTLRLLPGEHMIRVLVRTAAGGFGARSHSLVVPEPGEPRASMPLVEEVSGWLVVTDPPTGSSGEMDYPLAWNDRRRVPAAAPRLVGEGPWEAWVVIGDLLQDAPGDSRLTAQFKALDGVKDSSSAVEVVERVALLDDSALRLRIENPGLSPGRYELTLVAASAAGGDLESPVLPLRIEGTGAADAAPPRIASNSKGTPPSRRKKTSKRATSRRRAVAMAPYVEGYRRVLNSTDQGTLGAVHASLEELVLGAWKDLPGEAPGLLSEALAQVLEEDGALDGHPKLWQELLPLIQAHLDLANSSLEELKYALAQFAARTALDLAMARSTALGTATAAREAAAVATCLAKAYLETGSRALAETLLDRALELDGEQQAALLLRGALQEKEGKYSESASTLRRLVEAHPEHGEGQLRLAMQETRLRQGGRARRRFEGLLEKNTTPWVRLVAVQELARLHRGAGRRGQAEDVLRQAAEEWPHNARLKTLRAQLLDDSRDYVLARFLVARPGDEPANSDPLTTRRISERELYNRWPVEAVGRLALELESAARESLSRAETGP